MRRIVPLVALPPSSANRAANRLGVTEGDLHSRDLQRRYKASIAGGASAMAQRWPFGCGGAGNAFLVLIGPSMGGTRKDEAIATGGANRPVGKPRRIGADAMRFDWGDHRKARWIRLCAESL